jgi:hypothetical protein
VHPDRGLGAAEYCPFAYCRASMPVHLRPPASDRLDELVKVYPLHQVRGKYAWYGTCPGSQLMLPLSERGTQVLEEAGAILRRRHVERINERVRMMRDEGLSSLEEQNREIKKAKRDGTLGHLDRPGEDYFPPRPSDEDDARRTYDPGRVPADVEGHHLSPDQGAPNVSDNLRAQLRALIHLTITSAEQLNASVTASYDGINLLDAQLAAAYEKADAAVQMANAAIGSDNHPPEAAVNMRNAAIVARAKVEEAQARLNAVQLPISLASASAVNAGVEGRRYLGQV